jgi:hypothetical protein
MRTVLVARGTYRPTSGGRGILKDGLYRYTTRLTFYRGKSFVKVEHDIENSGRAQPQWNYLFREASLNFGLSLAGPTLYSVGGWSKGGTERVTGEGALPGSSEAWLVQREPATTLQHGRHTAHEGGFVAGIGRAGSVVSPIALGGRGRYLDISDGEKGVAVAVRYLWEQAPRSLAVSRERLAVFLHADAPSRAPLPGQRRPEYDLDFGERHIHDVLLYFHAGNARDALVADVAEAFEYPLFAYAPPAWYADTGTWYFELSRTPVPPKRDADRHWQPDSSSHRWHGENSSYNSGGNHDSQSSGWLPFIRSGDLGELERQLAQSRWSIAHNPGWAYMDNRLRFGVGSDRNRALDRALAEWDRLTGFGAKDFYVWMSEENETYKSPRGELRSRRRGGFSYLNGYKVLPDIEHYALFRLFEYYNLTGDARALDSIHGFLNWAVNFQQRHIFQGKSLPLSVTDHFDRDRQALYRGHYSRIYAWMLYTTLAGFQSVGSPVFDEFARWQLRRALALLRERHGQFTRIEASQKGSSMPESRTKSWMEAIAVPAFHEAYKTYGDERILDAIWAQADYFAHHVIYFPRLGMINSVTAMPNDLLSGEGKGEERSITPIRHDWHTQAWPILYHYTGWPSVAERFRGFEAARKGGKVWVGDHFLQTIDWQEQNQPKRTTSPPEPVKDLSVVKADRSGIALTWTSPADDGVLGRASRYFVKVSDKPIVENAPTDDPSRDTDKRRIVNEVEKATLSGGKWNWRSTPTFRPGEIRGEPLNARRVHPDWHGVNAFWMAEHVAGEPLPGPAGTRESFTITELRPHAWFGAPKQPGLEILPAGTYYIALCSWDEDQNLSRLSNVVRINLR